MRRYALRDDQWERIKELLPGREGHVGDQDLPEEVCRAEGPWGLRHRRITPATGLSGNHYHSADQPTHRGSGMTTVIFRGRARRAEGAARSAARP